jgi:hypothetical protein
MTCNRCLISKSKPTNSEWKIFIQKKLVDINYAAIFTAKRNSMVEDLLLNRGKITESKKLEFLTK